MKLTTSVKVACGYIILTGLLLGTIYYIYTQTASLTQQSDTEITQTQRRKAIHELVSKLFEAEHFGQTIHIGQWEAYRNYVQAIGKVQDNIRTLDSLYADTLQKERLHTLSLLLESKKENMKKLLIALGNDGSNQIYRQQINRLIESKDSVTGAPHMAREIIQREETLSVKKEKKRFFRRLAEAFHPNRKDSAKMNTRTTQITTTDTLIQKFNAGDTLANILNHIEKDVERYNARRKNRINAQTERLTYTDIELNAKVTDLLESIELDEQARIQQETAREFRTKRQAAVTTAAIAITAILFAIIFFIIVWRDLTHSNHFRKELEKAKEKAEDLLATREKLMLTVTHDIKAPVSSIIGYTDLLQPYMQEGKPADYLHNIRTSSEHLLHLVVSLLDYHKLENRQADHRTENFNLSNLLHATTESFRPAAQRKHLELYCETSPETDRTFSGEALRIRQIAENLLGNALKFTKAGFVRMKAGMQGNTLLLEVEDSGCGMTEEEQKIIFKAFTRLKSAQGEEGVGLGLSITLKIIEWLKGTIRVESVPGKGSRFSVTLPLQTTETTKEQTETSPLQPPSRNLNIIIVDDDRMQLQLTRAMLEQIQPAGYHWNIACCHSPEEVFQNISLQPFDILLSDIQMPAMNGFELLHRLQDMPPINGELPPVIAVTARQDMDEEYFRQNGFSTCLYKPFSRNDLVRAIRQVLADSSDTPLDGEQQPEKHAAPSPTFDFTPLTAFAGDDKEAAYEIMKTFREETERHIACMQQAYMQRNKTEVCRLAHKLLPTFTLIGASCTKALQTLDAKREEKDWDETDTQLVQSILDELHDVLSALKHRPM